MALTSLVHAPPRLNTLITYGAPPRAMIVLPIFTSLQHCDLTAPETDNNAPLDLSSLQALPKLQHLKLQQGKFCNLHAAAYLTSLAMYEGSVTSNNQDCACANSLRKLSVKESKILGFHAMGVCACTALEWLEIQDSVIGATQRTETLRIWSLFGFQTV